MGIEDKGWKASLGTAHLASKSSGTGTSDKSEQKVMGGGVKKKLPVKKVVKPKEVEMVEITRTIKRCGKQPREVKMMVPKGHHLA